MSTTSSIDALLNGDVYPKFDAENEQLFISALHEEIRFNALHNKKYGDFLRRKNIDINSIPSVLEDLPFLPVQIFKVLGRELCSVEASDIRTALSSSATSGVPSTVMLDAITAKRQFKSMAKVLMDVLGKKRRPFYIFDINPYDKHGAINARSAAVRAYLNFASRASFYMEQKDNALVFDLTRFAQDVAQADKQTPAVIFAFTYVLYGEVVKPGLSMGITHHLPQGTQIIHIGGWKKLESEKVSKAQFNVDVAKFFDVDVDNIIDIYGFTEQMGINYPDCACGCKHTPALSRVIVRDPETHAPLPHGKTGVLEFLSPVPHSYPGNIVLTDDLGVIEDAPCPMGKGGTRFRILGRMKKAEVRGCGDILGEKIRMAAPAVVVPSHKTVLETHHYLPCQHFTEVAALATAVRAQQAWLLAQPVEALIGLIHTVAQSWMHNKDLAQWKYQGLAFLVQWCRASHLRRLLRDALHDQPDVLDRFKAQQGKRKYHLRAMPKGLACHWLAGNVPLLGMLLLVQSILTKNCNILKTSSVNMEAMSAILDTFKNVNYTTVGGYTLNGNDLLKSIALIYYPHNALDHANAFSQAADIRIAWGGKEAIDAICSLPNSVDCVDIVYGPKTSFMVIAKENISTEKEIKRLLRRAATDVSVFDQMACASPHTIFIENGGSITPQEFAQRLAGALDKTLLIIPRGEIDAASASAIQTARAVGGFLGECWCGKNGSWTVLYDEQCALATPVYGRTVTVRGVDSINDAAALVKPGIQTIGLAATGDKELEFASLAAQNGALRFPEIGKMTHFDSKWDGISVVDRLIKWITLGGPEL